MPVLVVDDNKTNLRILTEMLAEWGMRPHAEKSAKEAMQARTRMKQGQRCALVITDLNMPEMDGFELAAKIRKSFNAKELPMLLLSSSLQGASARSANRSA